MARGVPLSHVWGRPGTLVAAPDGYPEWASVGVTGLNRIRHTYVRPSKHPQNTFEVPTAPPAARKTPQRWFLVEKAGPQNRMLGMVSDTPTPALVTEDAYVALSETLEVLREDADASRALLGLSA